MAVPLSKPITTRQSDEQIYYNDAPTDWTDLNLSPYIGPSKALVYLLVANIDSSLNTNYRFRTKGDNREIGNGADASGCTVGRALNSGGGIYVTACTDEQGLLQWKADTASVFTRIYLRAFILLR